ncbi:hypothetical protein E2C01_075979 [Portunus trituberculatus]|uniref:Uncharacterized protein n=1 Tax=Portunus trituberculatus TaxID=210409 RepID=A0A5B7III5_PORTR|nr:hypothetical protein [Portunus trituberculatus]
MRRQAPPRHTPVVLCAGVCMCGNGITATTTQRGQTAYSTAQHHPAQRGTAPISTARYHTAQQSTSQDSTVRYSRLGGSGVIKYNAVRRFLIV